MDSQGRALIEFSEKGEGSDMGITGRKSLKGG